MNDKHNSHMCEKPHYQCAICNTVYDDVQKRMTCEMKCLKKAQEEEQAAIEAKKKAEKELRRTEVSQAIEQAMELLKKYTDDYGSFEFYNELSNISDNQKLFWPSRLMHHFFF